MDVYGDILAISSPLSLIIGLLIGIYYRKCLKRDHRILCMYLFVCIFFDVFSRYLGSISGNNLITWPLFSLVELFVFSAFYLETLKKRKWILGVVLLGISYILFEIIYIDAYNVKVFQSYAKIVTSFLIVVIVLAKIIREVQTDQIISKNEQRLNNIILIVFSLNVLLLLPINLLVNGSSVLITAIWIIYLSITVLFYIYLSFTIWKNGKNRKRLSYGS